MDTKQLKDRVVDQLAGLEHFTTRAMFGGYGLYHDGNIFGVIADRLYFKTDASTRDEYTAASMGAWPESKQYYEVPPAVLDDPTMLADWARRAAAISARAKEKSAKRPKR